MKRQSQIIKIISRVFNVRRWFDWDRMKAFTLYLGNGFIRLFVPQKNIHSESFEEAVHKLNLSDEALLLKKKSLFRLSVIMTVASVLVLVYAGYQLYSGSIKAFLVSLVVTLIGLVLAFRYHFWYFQIKERKLGCTIQEWYREGLLGEKK